MSSPSLSSNAESSQESVPARRYRTAVSLSSGGTAEIFKAWDERLDRYVALKFLRRDHPGLVDRMLREARAQGRLDHPGICKVYDIGEMDGRPFIAMQYVDGVELGELIHDLTLEEKVLILWRVAESMHYAHQEGLVHRDLKPSNIMVERRVDDSLWPVVVDFGLVHEPDGTAFTLEGQVLGTPPYLAPEQVEGRRERFDRRTDVYGLGATAYHLLTGVPPFEGDRSVDLMLKTLHEDPLPPRRRDPSLPVDLENVVLQCLEKRRIRRYPSARALAEDLRRYLDGEAVVARPVSRSYRLARRAWRHRRILVPAAALLAAALVLLAVVRWRADQRLLYEQRFSRLGRDLGWSLRAVHMSSRHDITASREKVLAQIADLEAELPRLGSLGEAPARSAVGRAYAALQQDDKAVEHLQIAWDSGYRAPEVGYALGLVYTRKFQRRLQQVRHLSDPELRRAAVAEAEAELRDPAIRFLEAGRGTESVPTEYLEGLLAFLEDRPEQALAELEAARERLPWLYETDILKGTILNHQGDEVRIEAGDPETARAFYDRAEQAFHRAIASAGSDPEAYMGLCELLSNRLRMSFSRPTPSADEDFARADQVCGQILEVDPSSARGRLLRASERVLQARRETWTGGDPLPLFEQAEALARGAVELEPDRATVHAGLASVHLTHGEYLAMSREGDPRPVLEEAIAAAERALERRPSHPVYLNLLGSAWSFYALHERRLGLDAKEATERSIRALEEAVAQRPRSFDLRYNLASSLGRRCDLLPTAEGASFGACLEEKETAYRKALELNDEFNWAHVELGQTLQARGVFAFLKGEDPDPFYASALESVEHGIALGPEIHEFHQRRGVLFLTWGQFDLMRGRDPAERLEEARKSLAEAFRIRPSERGESLLTLRIEDLRLRWALATGEPVDPALERGDRAFERLAKQSVERSVEGDYVDIYLSQHLVWKAHALQRTGRSAREPIELGLERVEDHLRDRQTKIPEHLGLRGMLRVLESRETEDTEARRRLGEKALADLEAAIEGNRWLAVDLDPWLLDLRQILEVGPRLREAKD